MYRGCESFGSGQGTFNGDGKRLAAKVQIRLLLIPISGHCVNAPEAPLQKGRVNGMPERVSLDEYCL